MSAPIRNSKGRFQKKSRAAVPKQLWAFEAPRNGPRAARSLRIKIVGDHPDFAQLMSAIGRRYIRFSEYRYVTANKWVARYLRELIKANVIPGLREDFSMYPIKCQFCAYELPDGGNVNKARMMDHIYAEHMDDPRLGGEDDAALTGEEDEE